MLILCNNLRHDSYGKNVIAADIIGRWLTVYKYTDPQPFIDSYCLKYPE